MGATHDFVPATAADHRRRAEKRLPRFLFDYLDGAAGEELTAAANVAAFQNLRVRQRVLRDVSAVEASTVLAGEQAALPLILAPVGMAGMMARRGEVQAARAAQATGIPFVHSTVGICSLEEVKAATGRPFWFQLYMLRDRGAVRALVERAEAAGCGTLVFTADVAVPGQRHRDRRNGLLETGPHGKWAKIRQLAARPRWVWDVGLRGGPHRFGCLEGLVVAPSDFNAFRAWLEGQFDPSVTWKDVEWLRGLWRGRLVIKGVLEPEDAWAASQCGAQAVVVSNHGGRQLDGVPPSLAGLPAIAERLGAGTEIYLDGGVRSGVDILKALALGARAVMIGRPWAYALAGSGEAGLRRFLAILKLELETAMALSGVTRVDQINREGLESS